MATESGRTAIENHVPEEEDEDEEEDEHLAALKAAEKESHKKTADDPPSGPSAKDFINPNFIVGTSDVVERSFSEAKNILTAHRAGMMSPHMFNTIMFLKANKDLWGLAEVATAVRMTQSKYSHFEQEDWKEWNDHAIISEKKRKRAMED